MRKDKKQISQERKVLMADCYRSDCERNVIGCIAQDVSLIGKYDLNKEDFSDIRQTIFVVLKYLYQQNYKEVTTDAIDMVLEAYPVIKQQFKRDGCYERMKSFIKLRNESNFEADYNNIKKCSLIRELIASGNDVRYFFDPAEVDPDEEYKIMKRFDDSSIEDIIYYFKNNLREVQNKFESFVNVIPRPIKINELIDKVIERNYIVDGMFYQNTINNIVGSAKAGKSFLSTQLAFCVQNGIDFLGHKTTKQDVLYIDFELDETELAERARNIYNKFSEYENLDGYQVLPLYKTWVHKEESFSDLIDLIKEEKNRNPKLGLIILDCFYCFNIGEENKAEDVEATLNRLNELRKDMTIFYIHHTTKGGVKNGDELNSGSGSGVHGRKVNQSLTIQEKDGVYTVKNNGRDFKGDIYKCTRDENGYFDLCDGRHILGGKTVKVSEDELKGKYPELYEAVGEEGVSLYSLQKQFPDINGTYLNSIGFNYDRKSKKVFRR